MFVYVIEVTGLGDRAARDIPPVPLAGKVVL
jgi:hypothetical protein